MTAVSSRLKWIVMALATLALAFTLSGCASQDYTKEFVGNYEMTAMTTEDQSVSDDDIAMLKEWGLTVTLELKEDKTGTLDLMGSEYDLTFKAESATKASMEMTDETGTKYGGQFVLENGKLLLTDERSANESITFTKTK